MLRTAFALMVAASLALACSELTGAPDSGEGGSYTIEHLTVGTGASPHKSQTVRVHYHGTFPDGTVFDSSVERGRPATFPLNRVISCWTLGLQEMKVGGKAKLTCPPDFAYGENGAGKIPPNATILFEVELLEIL